MGKPFTIQLEDDQRLEKLKQTLGLKTKVETLRKALDSLEANLKNQQRVTQWKKAAKLAAKQSAKVNKEFQAYSLLKK